MAIAIGFSFKVTGDARTLSTCFPQGTGFLHEESPFGLQRPPFPRPPYGFLLNNLLNALCTEELLNADELLTAVAIEHPEKDG